MVFSMILINSVDLPPSFVSLLEFVSYVVI